ncbi:MAG: glutamate--tRNA ligase [candidate division KSB1 bacterium]|nr:glutamate--tRNA ligase [candidate division KSB1 bacterium]MDZ7275731.1 glutamate--tRNA ligase [candidate division KSB1 bacterium]MDZ7284578.1 glutamate--tRNA ligase [candidate division KSB1 bacterium]MDZ7298003.1 glutamate--tRNA ligase [candidate division KSB1 bacterium]MDZ7305829.1 glutamate--tRNA ligase [candidate division KSB1 bacterium]
MVVVRFAPSPTGYLHIGGARTAIFNWLFARKHGGKFFLRIEDTDQQRSGEEMTQAIIDSLHWLGLDWDAEPIKQSDRLELYRQVAHELLATGKAYRSFTTAEALAAARQRAAAEKRDFRYRAEFPRLPAAEEAARLAQGDPFAIRLPVPEGVTEWEDQVHGRVAFDNRGIDDFVILRSDGQPTYHLAVVVDDHAMGITHVLRGDDHISNTPKQILLYRALGWDMPVFAHVPLILGPDKTRLSKRHGATAVGEYAKKGYLPEALFNFLALLGWSPGDDREILSRQELIERFDLRGISQSNAVFDEKKLEWMNGEYLNRVDAARIEGMVLTALRQTGGDLDERLLNDRTYVQHVITLLKPKVRTIPEFAKYGAYFFAAPVVFEESARAKYWRGAETAAQLRQLAAAFEQLPEFNAATSEACLRSLAEQLGIKAANLIHPARLAITGFGVSPSFFEVVAVLGKERVVQRLRQAATLLAS